MEEIEAQDKVGFSASRHKDITYGVVQCQTSSMFSGSFMSDQSSLSSMAGTTLSLYIGNNYITLYAGNEQLKHLENYESLAAMNLNSVTQTNVPEPFSPSIDRDSAPRANMPEISVGQQNKFTASDLQETLYPHSNLWFKNWILGYTTLFYQSQIQPMSVYLSVLWKVTIGMSCQLHGPLKLTVWLGTVAHPQLTAPYQRKTNWNERSKIMAQPW